MILLDGKKLSLLKYEQISRRVHVFSEHHHRRPKLSVILVGDDPASHVYVNNKRLACEKVGMLSEVITLDSSTTSEELRHKIEKLNQDPHVDGFLVQMPLPETLKGFEPSDYINPVKDVDGLCSTNMGLMMLGKAFHEPCTPEGVMELLKHYKIPLAGKTAVVVGRSQTVGWPMAFMLTRANCTVTVCHSKTPNIVEWTKKADIVVVAAGKPKLFSAKDFKESAVVVDVGIHKDGKRLVGDVDGDSLVQSQVGAFTPVPGGVGPMTVAQLIEHTLRAAEMSTKLKK